MAVLAAPQLGKVAFIMSAISPASSSPEPSASKSVKSSLIASAGLLLYFFARPCGRRTARQALIADAKGARATGPIAAAKRRGAALHHG